MDEILNNKDILSQMEEIKKCVKFVRNFRAKKSIPKNKKLIFTIENCDEIPDGINNLFLKLANFNIVAKI